MSVFLDHYWLEGESRPLAKNIACLDYSVARPGGKLVACRWDGEQELQPDKFVSVPRVEVLNERHLKWILASYFKYYNLWRTHPDGVSYNL